MLNNFLNKIKEMLAKKEEEAIKAYGIPYNEMKYRGYTVYYEPKFMKENDLTFAVSDSLGRILVDDNFFNLDLLTQDFILLHEEGHIKLKHLQIVKHMRFENFKRSLLPCFGKVAAIELEADEYACNKLGKTDTMDAIDRLIDSIEAMNDEYLDTIELRLRKEYIKNL